MSKTSPTADLRKMSDSDLQRELTTRRLTLAGLAIGVRMNKEKDTALCRKERRSIARILTILRERRTKNLKENAASPTMRARPTETATASRDDSTAPSPRKGGKARSSSAS